MEIVRTRVRCLSATVSVESSVCARNGISHNVFIFILCFLVTFSVVSLVVKCVAGDILIFQCERECGASVYAHFYSDLARETGRANIDTSENFRHYKCLWCPFSMNTDQLAWTTSSPLCYPKLLQ